MGGSESYKKHFAVGTAKLRDATNFIDSTT
jgi:hypothetical protein